MSEITIEITGKTAATEPNLPSHLFPGCGSDHGTFYVTSGDTYRSVIESAIESVTGDPVQVNDYDEDGSGSFVVIDGEAPIPGTVIKFQYNDY